MPGGQPPLYSARTHKFLIVMSLLVIGCGVFNLGYGLLGFWEGSFLQQWLLPIFLVVMGGYLLRINHQKLRFLQARAQHT